MKAYFLITLCTLFLASSIPSQAQRRVIYDLPDARLRSEVICGKAKVCDPGPNRGIVYRFAVVPYSPDIDDNSTPHSVAAGILGHAVRTSLNNSEVLNVCSNDGFKSLIKKDDITVTGGYGTAGRTFDYDVKKTLTIDTKAAAEANIAELKKNHANARSSFLDSLKAKLELVYQNIRGKQLNVTATYSEWALKTETITKIRASPEFAECRQKLRDNAWAIVTDIGLIVYNISFDGKSVAGLGSDLDAQLKREGINFALGALIKKEVSKSLTAQTVQGYQVIGWRKMVIN